MPRRIVDISAPLMAGIASDPPEMLPRIASLDHHATAPGLAAYRGVAVSALPAEVEAELARIGHALRPLEIVLANTRAGSRYGQADCIDTGCGIGKAATLFLLERGVLVTGTDGWSWDAPLGRTRRRVRQTGDASLICKGHRAGREIGYCRIEKLSNLKALPPHGFPVACFPVKVHRGSAGWTRAVAIFEE